MTHSPFALYQNNAFTSGSSFNIKRKLDSGYSDDDQPQPMRIRSPPLTRRATFPTLTQVPELVTDYSNSNSASDEDMAMDQDDSNDNGMESPGLDGDDREFVPRYDYEYGMSGSGGIGFGLGAEEDGESMEESYESVNAKPAYSTYPSLTPHTNPNHFSNIPPYTSQSPFQTNGSFARSSSPLSTQPFSTSLRPTQNSSSRGLLQPTSAGPLPSNASEIEKARSAHGPNCKSIPKLVISPHPDPMTGKQAMYSMCPDCGTCERAA